MFKIKRKEALTEQEQDKAAKASMRVQDVNQNDDQDRAQSSSRAAPAKKEKTKEELAEIRKAMMKNRPKNKQNNFGQPDSNPAGDAANYNQSLIEGGPVVMSK